MKPGELHPRRWKYIEQTAGTSVSEVRFLPYTAPGSSARSQHLVVTLGKSVWSVLSVWSVTTAHGGGCGEQSSRKVAEWGPRGAIFTGFVVNDNADSGVIMVISFQLYECVITLLVSNIIKLMMQEIFMIHPGSTLSNCYHFHLPREPTWPLERTRSSSCIRCGHLWFLRHFLEIF